MAKLSAKQKAFCQYYVENRNATLSAVKAGYSERSANVQGSQNLAKPSIQEEINVLLGHARAIAKKGPIKVSVETLVQELAKGAFVELDPMTMKYSDKLKALELLCKHLGILDGQGAASSTKSKAGIRQRLIESLAKIG